MSTQTSSQMPADLHRQMEATGGVITTSQAEGLGVTRTALMALARGQCLDHVGRGAYVERGRLNAASPEGAHALRARAIASTWPTGVALSHYSAACVLGLPIIGDVPRQVHGVRTGAGEHRRTKHYTVHTAYRRFQTHQVGPLRVVEPAVAVLGVCEQLGLRAGVVTADAALHRGVTTTAELQLALDRCGHRAGRPVLRAVLDQVDPASESPAESWARLVLLSLGYLVQSQVEIRDPSTGRTYRSDFRIKGQKVLVEVDGMSKYTEHAVLVREKKRQESLTRLGWEVVRLSWADLGDPELVRKMVDEALRREARRAR